MEQDSDLGQRKVVNLDRGLFLIEYRSAEDQSFPPKVVVSAARGHAQRVEIITHPDSDGETLWQPQAALVVRALEPATLDIMVLPTRSKGSCVAAVRIEPISQGTLSSAVQDNPVSDDIKLDQIRVLGHVAGIGDVVVPVNEWIAGPTAPSRIEGLSIGWPQQPDGLDIRYSVKSGTGQGPAGKLVGAGEFAGTRGRALPITGLNFEISGGRSQDYVLAADAIFLSSPAMRVTGTKITLSGPTGREPLVGLRLTIERAGDLPTQAPAKQRSEPAPKNTTTPAPPAAKPPSSGRVRVFRSRTKQTGD